MPALYSSVQALSALLPKLTGEDIAAPVSVRSVPIQFNSGQPQRGESLALHSLCDLKPQVGECLADELALLHKLYSEILASGQEFASLLYCWRSCAKPLPMVQGNEDENVKHEIHIKTFALLAPQIGKLTQFRKFTDNAIRLVMDGMKQLQRTERDKSLVQSEELSSALLQCIDLLLVVDALKDMKACLLNDFSRYKRSFTSIRAQIDDRDAISNEIMALQEFLSNPIQPHGVILSRLRDDMQKLSSCDSCLLMLMNFCSSTIDAPLQFALSPTAQHQLHRSLLALLYLYDGLNKNQSSIFANNNKSLDMRHIAKQFKSIPVIPLYADMHLDTMLQLARCRTWPTAAQQAAQGKITEESIKREWQTHKPEKIPIRYLLQHHVNHIRREFNETSTLVQQTVSEAQDLLSANQQSKNETLPVSLCSTVFDTVRLALQRIASWTSLIHQQQAYKYSKPASADVYAVRAAAGASPQGQEYEKAIRFNFSHDDKYTLCDVISLVKGLSSMLQQHTSLLLPFLHSHMFVSLQSFVHGDAVRVLRRTAKSKKSGIKPLLMLIRSMAGDFTSGNSSLDDWLAKSKSDDEPQCEPGKAFPMRIAPPTQLQISLLRRLMICIFSPSAAGMQGGLFTDKDVKKDWLPAWQELYSQSAYYPALLNLPSTILDCSDLSCLWFREFYLEVTKCVQFPIEMSLPWILTEFLIKSKSQKENMLLPLSIYNDAGRCALLAHKQQFLFDECEAELNLSFQQFLFLTSEDIFKHYKTQATHWMINKTYEKRVQQQAILEQRSRTGGQQRLPLLQIDCRYRQVVSQRIIPLLSHSVDVHRLISQELNDYVKKNIEYVLLRFESQDLQSLPELAQLLDHARTTHYLLTQDCGLCLDSFDDLFAEANQSGSLVSYKSRLLLHCMSELIHDILPGFVYNSQSQRFVRSPVQYCEPAERSNWSQSSVSAYFWYGTSKSLSAAMDRLTSIQKQFFGAEHCESMLAVLGSTAMPLLVCEIVNRLVDQLQYDFAPYIGALQEGAPKMSMPNLAYGIVGAYGVFDVKLSSSLGLYPPLRSNVFHLMRDMGNAAMLVQLIDNQCTLANMTAGGCATQVDVLGIKLNANGQLAAPESNASESDASGPCLAALQQAKSVSFNAPLLLEQAVGQTVHSAKSVYSHDSTCSSMTTFMLNKIQQTVNENLLQDWLGPKRLHDHDEKDTLLEVEQPKDVTRILSCLAFIFCTPIDDLSKRSSQSHPGQVSDIAAFGDGWAFIHALMLHLTGLRARYNLTDLAALIQRVDTQKPIDRAKHAALQAAVAASAAAQSSGKNKAGLAQLSGADQQEALILEFLNNVFEMQEKTESFATQLAAHISPAQPKEERRFRPQAPTTESEASAASGHATGSHLKNSTLTSASQASHSNHNEATTINKSMFSSTHHSNALQVGDTDQHQPHSRQTSTSQSFSPHTIDPFSPTNGTSLI